MCFTELRAGASGPTPMVRGAMRAPEYRGWSPKPGTPQTCLCGHERSRHTWTKLMGWQACRMGMNYDTTTAGCPCPLYEQDPVDKEVNEVLAFLARGV